MTADANPEPCIPPGMNRRDRRAWRTEGHVWKTGSDPSIGQFCAVCGTKRTGTPKGKS